MSANRAVNITDNAESFDAALALAVRIIEEEGLTEPSLVIQPASTVRSLFDIFSTEPREDTRRTGFQITIQATVSRDYAMKELGAS